MSGSRNYVNIIDLKPNQENVNVKGRVLETSPPHVINTKKGPRTISNAVLGDATGRVEVTLWGEKAGSLKNGEVIEVIGAWTTVFRGKVQLNIGKATQVNRLDDGEAPPPEDIPEDVPRAPETTPFGKQERPSRGRGFKPRRRF